MSKEAEKAWLSIPPKERLLLLNNAWCKHCNTASSIGFSSPTQNNKKLILSGICTKCGNKISRALDVHVGTTPGTDSKNPDISKYLKFRKGSKNHELLENITALKVTSYGDYSPTRHIEHYEMLREMSPPADDILNEGDRALWEIEYIMPNDNLDSLDGPLEEAQDYYAKTDDFYGAKRLVEALLREDPRCIAAYAQLGFWFLEFNHFSDIKKAKEYFKLGVAICAKSINSKINDVFLWGIIDNRSFLRCLFGLAYCYYLEEKMDDALILFTKSFWLNPTDELDARSMIHSIVNEAYLDTTGIRG